MRDFCFRLFVYTRRVLSLDINTANASGSSRGLSSILNFFSTEEELMTVKRKSQRYHKQTKVRSVCVPFSHRTPPSFELHSALFSNGSTLVQYRTALAFASPPSPIILEFHSTVPHLMIFFSTLCFLGCEEKPTPLTPLTTVFASSRRRML